jgi:hypothetical protein
LLTQHQRHQTAACEIAAEIDGLLDDPTAEPLARLESRARSTLPLSVASLARAIRFIAEARVAASEHAPDRARQLLLVARGLAADFGAAHVADDPSGTPR